jgi:hypothetical protein
MIIYDTYSPIAYAESDKGDVFWRNVLAAEVIFEEVKTVVFMMSVEFHCHDAPF